MYPHSLITRESQPTSTYSLHVCVFWAFPAHILWGDGSYHCKDMVNQNGPCGSREDVKFDSKQCFLMTCGWDGVIRLKHQGTEEPSTTYALESFNSDWICSSRGWSSRGRSSTRHTCLELPHSLIPRLRFDFIKILWGTLIWVPNIWSPSLTSLQMWVLAGQGQRKVSYHCAQLHFSIKKT